jgi:hypothetical protein
MAIWIMITAMLLAADLVFIAHLTGKEVFAGAGVGIMFVAGSIVI